MMNVWIFIFCFCFSFVSSGCLQVNAQCADDAEQVRADQSEKPSTDAKVDNSDKEQELDVEN